MNARHRHFDKTSPPLLRPQGADLLPEGGVRHRLWAPQAERIDVAIYDENETEIIRTVPLAREEDGFFQVTDPEAVPNERYKYRVGETYLPDPFSRWQPRSVWGASMIIDPSGYRWVADQWERRPLEESVIYEMHIGTFTPEGTFLSAIERLDALVDLGITTIELMPISAFPGKRNWGYDGVMLFAPDSSYGHPDDLRALVDAAHQRGLNVLLDVVYNHFGPDGNYLASYSPQYFNSKLKTPWGDAIRFSGADSRHVRAVFLANIAYWMQEFRIDGFRLDATHEILDDSTPHILAEIARTAHQQGGIVFAEDDRNLAELAAPDGETGLDGLWADDFHHTIHVALTREQEGYFSNFSGTPQELAETIRSGWFYRGQVAPLTKAERGTPPEKLRIEQFVHCISNHDQIGNRAFGERLHHLVSPEAWRAASALLCLTPGTPMLFMGQEWAASSPFFYFTDHRDELGKKVTEGRQKEFEAFIKKIRHEGRLDELPDPQAESTFLRSKLNWDEIPKPGHAETHRLYKELLQLRASAPSIQKRSRETVQVKLLGDGITGIRFEETLHSGLLVLADLEGGHQWKPEDGAFAKLPPGWTWKPILSTNESRFGGDGSTAFQEDASSFVFEQPEVLVLQPARAT